jgi:hypothetical protein
MMLYYTYYYGVSQHCQLLRKECMCLGKQDVSVSSEGGDTPTQLCDLRCPATLIDLSNRRGGVIVFWPRS